MNKCLYCKKEFPKQYWPHTNQYCSQKCYHIGRIGKPHGRTNKRKDYLIYNGYRFVRVPHDYKGGYDKRLKCGKYLQEHRFVAEKMLGRTLKRKEIVHHINFNKLDNRPENLMILTQSQHKKLECKLAKLAMKKFNFNKKQLLEIIDIEIT